MLRCSKLSELVLAPGKLAWPWVVFTPERTAFAVPVGPRALALRSAEALAEVREVPLPEALAVPSVEPSIAGTTSRQPGLHSVALHPDGTTVVAFGWHQGIPVAYVHGGGASEIVDLGPALGDLAPMAATFTKDGASLWLSAESEARAALVRLRFRDFALEGTAAFPVAPPPALHELFLHPVEEAVLLAMSCGQDGTFVRVARWGGESVELIATEGDKGLEPCGHAEVTEDGKRLCLVSSAGVEIRSWPGLALEARADAGGDLVTNYNGIRLGGRFLVSATDQEKEDEERVLVLTDAAVVEDNAPAPPGMWAGRLGRDRLVTIDRGGEGARRGFVYVVEM